MLPRLRSRSLVLGVLLLVVLFLLSRGTPSTRPNSRNRVYNLWWRQYHHDTPKIPFSPIAVEQSEVIEIPHLKQSHSREGMHTAHRSDAHEVDPLISHPSIPPEAYSRAVVIAHTRKENIAWSWQNLLPEPNTSLTLYAVDGTPDSSKIRSVNGKQVMPYLTYMINNYDDLCNVTIFMQGHRNAWYNNELLDHDSILTLQRLSIPKVLREGYFNLRCDQDPGCPAALHPIHDEGMPSKDYPEAEHIAQAWRDIFPDSPVPLTLSQPYGSQFAVSAERVRSVPRQRYMWLRKWLEDSELDEKVTGRIFAYVWQYLWTNQTQLCPEEHICHCDAYAACLGGKHEYSEYVALKEYRDSLERTIEGIIANVEGAREDDWQRRVGDLRRHANGLTDNLRRRKQAAWSRGMEPQTRAKGIGRIPDQV